MKRYLVVSEPAEGGCRLHVIDTQPGDGFSGPTVVASATASQRGALNRLVALANEAVDAQMERQLEQELAERAGVA